MQRTMQKIEYNNVNNANEKYLVLALSTRILNMMECRISMDVFVKKKKNLRKLKWGPVQMLLYLHSIM